ncbi:uncharacterized protein B0T23DRAFT_453264 [Neurospora hispaniola]|uniref:Uncharacterized protein n=1 Tax=Neurospora hispaniola TaxID=588809 RepID=A0AAJ0I747_9PEZI|nr:hypothetical protein B0T23DRAFT_453264 [Neurospora hispaniola]
MSRRYPDKKYYDNDRGLPPRPPRSQRDQRDDDNRRERDYPPARNYPNSNYSSSSRNPPDRRNPPPRSDYGGSRNDRQRSRSPPPYPRRSNQIINNHQPGGLRSGRLSPPPRERQNDRSTSGRNSPARSTSSGNRTPAPARTAQPSRAPSHGPSRAPSPARAPPSPSRALAPASATKPKGFSAPKTKNPRNTFHFLELSLVQDAIIHDSHILQDLGQCIDECEQKDPNTPWEQQERGKEFLKWFEEYRSSVTTLRPVVPGMRDHALLTMKDMIKKKLTRRKLFTELYPPPSTEDEKKDTSDIKNNNPNPEPKPTIDVSTDVICLLRPPPFSKRSQYITFAPYHLSSSPTQPSPSNILITTSPALTNLSGSHPFSLSSALPVLQGLKRVAFLWDSASPPNGPGPLPADLAFLFPDNLPSLETIYILHPEIRPRSEWFWVSPECDTFMGGEGQGSEALFVEVREGDVEGTGTGMGTTGNIKGGSMWEVLGEENDGGGKRDVWGRGGGEEVKVSEGVRDALREVKALEGLYNAEGAKGKRNVKVKLMGCIPIRT